MKSKHLLLIYTYIFLFFAFVNNQVYSQNTETINLRAAFFEETIDSVCLGDTYNWRTNDYSQAGEYYDSLLTVGGEDSIYKLSLSVYTIYDYQNQMICFGDSAYLEGNWQYMQGIYFDTIVVAGQCDTVIQTELIVESPQSFKNISLCEGDSFFVAGAWQTTSAVYEEHYVSVSGCDSVARTRLIFKIGGDTTISTSLCEGDSIYFGGTFISNAGTYESTEPSQINGCDSTTTMTLTVIDLPYINATAEPETIEFGKFSQLYIEQYGPIQWSSSDTMSCYDCNNPIVFPTGTTTYYVETEVNYCTIIDSVTVTVVERELLVEPPEGFSPNGDGVNDLFVVMFLEEYPNNSIVIYNRWGNKVLEKTPYVNNWDGTNKFGGSIGTELPEGSYFYVLKLDVEKDDIIKGYVYLKR